MEMASFKWKKVMFCSFVHFFFSFLYIQFRCIIHKNNLFFFCVLDFRNTCDTHHCSKYCFLNAKWSNQMHVLKPFSIKLTEYRPSLHLVYWFSHYISMIHILNYTCQKEPLLSRTKILKYSPANIYVSFHNH